MLFSRCLLVVLAAVGVIAHSGHAEKRGMIKVHADLARRDYHEDAITQLDKYQLETTDAMAGPQPEREAKLVQITTKVAQLVKDYDANFRLNVERLDSSTGLGPGLPVFGKKLYVLLRSCKGTRSEALHTILVDISGQVDALGNFLAQALSPAVSAVVLPKFAKYSDRLDMIEMATKPY